MLMPRAVAFWFAARRTLLASAAACAVIGAPRRALADAADGDGVSLRWRAPSSCPDAAAVHRRVVALAGPDVALSADALVTEASGEFHVVLHVQVRGSIGERVLTAPSCDAAAESVAVVLAMSGTPSPPPEPEPPRPIPPRAVVPVRPPATPAPGPPPPPPTAPPARRSLVRLSAEGSFDVGTLPVPTAGSTLRVTVTPWRGLKAGLAGSLWLDQQGHLSSDASQGADFGLFTADAFGCYAWVPRRSFEVSPCALVELGRISATGEGATKNSSSTALWVGLGLGVEGRWELTRWLALAAELDGMVPTPGQSFSIKGGGTVHATSVVAARGHFGPEVRF